MAKKRTRAKARVRVATTVTPELARAIQKIARASGQTVANLLLGMLQKKVYGWHKTPGGGADLW